MTICTLWRDRCLGEVAEGKVSLSSYGEIVAGEWRRIPGRHPRVTLDSWILMPDHLHGILILGPVVQADEAASSLGTIVGQFKSKSTKSVRAMYRGFAWQERFHDHIVETYEELNQIRTYIRQNPERWKNR